MGLVDLEHTDAVFVSDAILKFRNDCDSNLDNVRGQGYDGASDGWKSVRGIS